MVKYFLKSGMDINENNSNYLLTPLMIACICHNVKIIKLLVEHNANINTCYKSDSIFPIKYSYNSNQNSTIKAISNLNLIDDFYNYTPLHFIVHHQDIEIIKYLIEKGADLNPIVNSNSSSTFFSLLNCNNKYEIIKYVIDKEIDINYSFGHEALVYFTEKNDYTMVQSMINKNTGINIEHSLKNSLISLSLKHNQMNLLKYLILKNSLNSDSENDINIESLLECSQDLLFILKNNNYEFVKEKLKTMNPPNQKEKFIKLLFLLLIKEEDMDLFAILMDKNYDININNIYPNEDLTKENETLLMTACRMNHLPIVQYFIDNLKINDINQQTKVLCNTPLILACEQNNIDIVKILVESGCDIHRKNNNGYSAVDIACMNGHFQIFIYLVEAGANLERHDQYNKSLLMMACEFGTLEMVDYLLNKKSNYYIDHRKIDAVDTINRTALMYACRRGHYDIVKCLIQHHCNINIISRYDGNALGYACEEGNAQIVKLLLDLGSDTDIPGKFGETEFIKGCKSNCITLVKYLVDHEININIQDRRGYTGLMRACENKNFEMVYYLIEQGADINLCNDYGYNAFLMLCDSYKNIKLIDYFIKKGININHRTKKDGTTALLIACDHEQYKLAKYLIMKGASVNGYNWKRQTPLMKSIIHENFEFSIYLIDNGANCFCYDKDGQSILDYCIQYDQYDLQKYIIQSHIFDNKLSIYNADTFIIACKKKNYSMIKYLIDHGININRNSKILSFVFEKCKLKLMTFLLDYGLQIKKEDHLILPFNYYYFDHFDKYKHNKKFKRVIQYLIEHGVSLRARNLSESAFFYAMTTKDLELIKWMITIGIDVNERNKNDYSIIYSLIKFIVIESNRYYQNGFIKELLKLIKYLYELGVRIDDNIFDKIPIYFFLQI